ncbi:hypothetical protein MTR_0093s0130 [Medicago truncatula]|uniref:Uncharacterized protein n=1 Tax=Medicago truncatula TaxID=3880 RepID=A0A072TIR6_MEDTR|nr:hypothetical protein MTR_0093s0130 [Medicago truncatula]
MVCLCHHNLADLRRIPTNTCGHFISATAVSDSDQHFLLAQIRISDLLSHFRSSHSTIAGGLSLRVQQLDVKCETKTKVIDSSFITPPTWLRDFIV